MTDWFSEENEIVSELATLDADVVALARPRDGTVAMLGKLSEKYSIAMINMKGADRVWELAGLLYLTHGRLHEALAIFLELYKQKLKGQQSVGRAHKGMPLTWIGETYRLMGFPVHSSRYLMLALCEDAITGQGSVSPNDTGSYFRLVWFHGLPDTEFRRYVSEFWGRREVSRGPVATRRHALDDVGSITR